MMTYRKLASLIKENREKRHLSQGQLAAACGISRASVVNIENGKQRIFLDQALTIAHALDIKFDEIAKIFFDDSIEQQFAEYPSDIQKALKEAFGDPCESHEATL